MTFLCSGQREKKYYFGSIWWNLGVCFNVKRFIHLRFLDVFWWSLNAPQGLSKSKTRSVFLLISQRNG